jgi:hypothetical protein
MFYAGMGSPAGSGTVGIGRATAAASNPYSWTQYASNPIFTGGGSVDLGSVVYDSANSTWYMYYHSLPANSSSIYLATSTDGFTFTPYNSGTAVLTPTGQGCSDGIAVEDASVLLDSSGTWYMFYSYVTSSVNLPGVRYATSSDGKTWTKGGCTDILSNNSAYDRGAIEWHTISKVSSYYVLAYEGYSGLNGSNACCYSINLAYSTSPTSGWTKSLANPILSGTNQSSAFDSMDVASPFFWYNGTNWMLFYQGTNSSSYDTGDWSLGITTLPSGLTPLSAIP